MFLILTILILLDRLSKYLALRMLATGPVTLGPFLNLHLSYNPGVSFSLLTWVSPVVLTSMLCVAITALAWFTWVQYQQSKRAALGYVFVLAGGASNLVDRIMHGAVVDFIDFHIGTWHFATFNLADMFIVGGVTYTFWRMTRDGNY